MPDTIIDPPEGERRPTVIDPEAANEGVRPTVVDDAGVAPAAPAAAAVSGPGAEASYPAAAPPEGSAEGGAPAPAPAGPAGPRKSRTGCVIAAIAFTVLALVGTSLAFYFLIWGYQPVARRHIPGNANLVVRIDPVEIATFAPARKHLWPLLEEERAGKKRSARFQDAVGINPVTDLREVIVASTDTASWVVLLGGRIKPGKLLTGLEKVAREEGWVGWQRQGDLFVGPGGVAVAQAEDGTVVVGTDTPIVRAALPASDEWQRLGLPERGALTFAVTREAWEGLGTEIGGMLPIGGTGLFRRPGRAAGAMTLGDTPKLTMRVDPAAGETAAALAADLESVLGGLKLVMLLMPDQVGEKAAIQSAQVKAGAQAVEINANWPRDGLERACERLARRIRAAGGS